MLPGCECSAVSCSQGLEHVWKIYTDIKFAEKDTSDF